LYSYKQGFYRCGDNLNMLGSTPTLAHPDRHDLPHWAVFEDWNLLTIQGFDTGSGVLTQPQGHLAHFGVNTDKGWEGVHYVPKVPFDDGGRVPQTPNRFALAGNEISIWDTNQTRNVKIQENNIAVGPFLPADEEFPYATIQHRIYLLRSRLNYYTTWDHRRPHEGAEDYQGDIFVHEGVVKFKQEVTLRGSIPISMEQINLKGASAAHLGDTFVVTDAGQGRVEIKFAGQKRSDSGAIAAGGYVYGGPTDAGILALVPDMEGMRYQLYTSSADPQKLDWQVFLGIGKDGQQMKAGDELPFRYLCVTLPARVKDPEAALQRMAASFGLTAPGYESKVEIGTLESQDVFFTGQAQGHEFQASFGPWPMILNRPFRIRGLEENGTAALYVLPGAPAGSLTGYAAQLDREHRFRFVPVVGGEAYFQQFTDPGARLWVGNVFYADNPALKLSLVMDGLTDAEKPFLEVHNPTDAAITATIQAPPHTPLFAGFSQKTTIPAGASVRLALTTKP
jgi:hypothetical protein